MPPKQYHIRVKGHLSVEWSEWFEGMTVTLEENGDTTLSGPVADQAALYGLLIRTRDLGLELISLQQVRPGEKGSPKTAP
jgi:hypothetical protein